MTTPAAATRLVGEVHVPGDKSISHRALVLSALAEGASTITGLNVGDDVLATARALAAMGVKCALDRTTCNALVEGHGWGGLAEPDDVLDAGNSGTTMRTILALCAGADGMSVVTGDATLRRRPMHRVVLPLREMGARIDGRRDGDLAPLVVRGGPLSPIDFDMEVASAQVKTAILLAGLRARGTTSVTEPAPSRDHTERMLAAAGVAVRRVGLRVGISGGQTPAAMDRAVPGDLSSAMFVVVAASLIPGSDVTVRGVGLNRTRAGAIDVLRNMGADLRVLAEGERGGEPVGSISIRASRLTAASIEGPEVPSLIDEVPILAVAASQAEGETVIRGAQELRVKESDRIDALVEGLRVLGGDVRALPDGLVVRGPTPLREGEVDSRGDHRIALAFAVAGLVAGVRVRVGGWECVNTSFPEFVQVLDAVRAPG